MHGWCCMAGSPSLHPSAQVGHLEVWPVCQPLRGACCSQVRSEWLPLPGPVSEAQKLRCPPEATHTPLCLPPAGSLSQEEAAPSLQAAMDAVHDALAKLAPADGTVTLRLQIAGDGRPTGLQWLCNTVRAGWAGWGPRGTLTGQDEKPDCGLAAH